MIELTSQDGTLLALNPVALWHVRAGSGEQTALYSTNGAVVFVRESYAEVIRLVKEWDAAA